MVVNWRGSVIIGVWQYFGRNRVRRILLWQ